MFGPIVAVGLGGIAVEILSEAALLRPPFGAAGGAIGAGRAGRRAALGGGRGLDEAEQEPRCPLVIGVGDLALELEEVVEVDVNPVRVADGAVLAADALVVLGGSDG